MMHGYHRLLRQNAWRTLVSFFQQRGQRYFGSISSPELSQIHCSQLSAYLAWGNFSLRQVYHVLLNLWAELYSRAQTETVVLHWDRIIPD